MLVNTVKTRHTNRKYKIRKQYMIKWSFAKVTLFMAVRTVKFLWALCSEKHLRMAVIESVHLLNHI